MNYFNRVTAYKFYRLKESVIIEFWPETNIFQNGKSKVISNSHWDSVIKITPSGNIISSVYAISDVVRYT
jgi:hypothetical protein